jgi:two-component system sensor histidine kinase AlgZ
MLPDFRNFAVILRIAVLAMALHLIPVGLVIWPDEPIALRTLLVGDVMYVSVLLSAIFVLYLASPRLVSLPYRLGCFIIILLVMVITSGWFAIYWSGWQDAVVELLHANLVAIAVSLFLLWYFNWRYRVLSPALPEARLIALQARIRPHFLFNSLNTVLGLIRSEPRRAEAILENLADLFRALMSESSTLVPLAKELELAKAYAEIEMVRLGKRLSVDWQCQGAPMDAMVPPLMLQPLLENAVYHGIEPATAGGTVSVTIFLKGEELNLVVRNPCQTQQERRSGNRIALNNIRERLDLHFDAEAAMRTYEAGEEFVVQIRMPYRRVGN